MGATISIRSSVPSPDSVRGEATAVRLQEYYAVTLAALEDAYLYWMHGPCDGNMKLPMTGFEEVFSGLVSDPEAHFDMFADLAGVAVNPIEVFLSIAAFAEGSAHARLKFMLQVVTVKSESNSPGSGSSPKSVGVADIEKLGLALLQGLQKLFLLKLPDGMAFSFAIGDSMSSFVRRTRSSHGTFEAAPPAASAAPVTIQEETDDEDADSDNDDDGLVSKAKTDKEEADTDSTRKAPIKSGADSGPVVISAAEVQLSSVELWNWAQDTEVVTAYLTLPKKFVKSSDESASGGGGGTNSLDDETEYIHVTAALLDSMIDGTIDESQYDFMQRAQNPLWTHTVHDMVDDTWYHTYPRLSGQETLMVALEHMILSTQYEDGGALTNPLAVHRPQAQIKNGSSSAWNNKTANQASHTTMSRDSSNKSVAGMYGSGMHASASGTPGMTGTASKAVFQKHLAPFNLMAPQVPGSKTSTSMLHAGLATAPLHNQAALLHAATQQHGNPGGVIDIIDVSSICAVLANLCPPVIIDSELDPANDMVLGTIGAEGAACDEQSEMALEIQRQVKTKRKQASAAGDIWNRVGLEMANTSLEEVPDCPFLGSRPRIASCPVFNLEHQAFNVIELYAKRTRNIPIASDKSSPNKVSNVLTGLNIAKFLCRHDVSLFGNSLNEPILDVGIARKSRPIPHSTNYGTAMTIVSRLDTEACLIVNTFGVVCGIFSSENVVELWRSWWIACNSDNMESAEEGSLQTLISLYQKKQFEHYDGSAKGFSTFSMLVLPLDKCQQFGLELVPFKEYRPYVPSQSSKVHSEKTMEKRNSTALAIRRTTMMRSNFSTLLGTQNTQLFYTKLRGGAIAYDTESSSSSEEEEPEEKVKSPRRKKTIVKGKKKGAKGKGSKKSPKKGGKGQSESETEKSDNDGGKGNDLDFLPSKHSDPFEAASAASPKSKKSTRTKKSKKRGKNKGSKKKKVIPLTPEEIAAQEEAAALAKEEQDANDSKLHDEKYIVFKSEWFTKHRAVKTTDTLSTALKKMCEYRCTKVFIIDENEGTLHGSVSLVDLCRRALENESNTRTTELSQYRLRRAVDVVVRNER